MKTPTPTPPRGSGTMPHCETAVEWSAVDCGALPARATVARFQGSGGAVDCHVTVQLTGDAREPMETLDRAWRHALASAGIGAASTVFRRFFCSDIANQHASLEGLSAASPGAVSVIGQPPLPAARFAIWSQHLIDPSAPPDIESDGAGASLRRGALTHHWVTGLHDCSPDGSAEQTRRVLEKHDRWLADHGMTLADNVVRTWWFVRDIDSNYQGLVDARREDFAAHGLGPDSHYIASTGIAGAPRESAAKLELDSHAISGLLPGQVEYLHAPDHLCPTHDYGVTFERATAVAYADRRHIYLSGTASIDPTGAILHQGDVLRQLARTLENIDALLAKAGANTGDLAVALVYLRDPSDGAVIEQALREQLAGVPFVLVHAPVCRPGWLIEIEGLAIVSTRRDGLPAY